MTSILPNGAPAGSAISADRRRRVREQVFECEAERGALVGRPAERRRCAHRQRRCDRPDALLECRRVRRAQQVQVRALVPQRADDRLGKAHLARKRLGILRRFGAGGEHRDVACAVGQRAKPDVDAGGRHVMQFDRDDARRQALAAAAQPLDQRAPALVVEQQARIAAARRTIGRQQRADARAEVRHAG